MFARGSEQWRGCFPELLGEHHQPGQSVAVPLRPPAKLGSTDLDRSERALLSGERRCGSLGLMLAGISGLGTIESTGQVSTGCPHLRSLEAVRRAEVGCPPPEPAKGACIGVVPDLPAPPLSGTRSSSVILRCLYDFGLRVLFSVSLLSGRFKPFIAGV